MDPVEQWKVEVLGVVVTESSGGSPLLAHRKVHVFRLVACVCCCLTLNLGVRQHSHLNIIYLFIIITTTRSFAADFTYFVERALADRDLDIT